MDKLSGLASKLGGHKSESSQQTSSNQTSSSNKEDYLDKALDKVETKFSGGKIDTQKMRDTNEKITDGARERFEKSSGYKVPEKFSN